MQVCGVRAGEPIAAHAPHREGRMRTSDEQKRDTKNVLLRAVNIALTAILALLLCFVLLKLFFITWVTVDQSSMYPTYEDGERVFVNRNGGVARGEVVVFYDADVSVPRLSSAFGLFAGDAKLLIKRVVAKEGDEIWLEELGGGEYALRIGCADTGEVIGEEYFDAEGAPVTLAPITLSPDTAGVLYATTRLDPYVVGEGCIFVMGDNRGGSVDSRAFGDVPLSRVIGTAMN